MAKEKLEKVIEFTPAYDKRHTNPKKNYGIGAVMIVFVLKGKKGAVSATFGTDWFMESTIKEYREKGNTNLPPPIVLRGKEDLGVRGWDIGVHNPVKQYDSQKERDCPWTKTGKCHYDLSGMRAEPYGKALIEKGSDEIWKMLEKEYKIQLG